MSWATTTDVDRFVETAWAFLCSRPVENTVLLTEAAYLAGRPSAYSGQLFGWWVDDTGAVAGAFVQAPRHPPVLSLLPRAAIDELPGVLAGSRAVGVDGRLVEPVVAAWRRHDVRFGARSRMTLWRLAELRLSPRRTGRPRTARWSDREQLVGWYRELMDAFPDDPSDLAYVVDDPLADGGITLWEVDGAAVAMAGRSRVVCGMTRLGAVYSSTVGCGHDDAAFVAACESARTEARDVVVFADAGDTATAARYSDLGFRPVLERVLLEVQG